MVNSKSLLFLYLTTAGIIPLISTVVSLAKFSPGAFTFTVLVASEVYEIFFGAKLFIFGFGVTNEMSPLVTEILLAVSNVFCHSNAPFFELYLNTLMSVLLPETVTAVRAPAPLLNASSESIITAPLPPRLTVLVLFLAKSYTFTSALPSVGAIARSSLLSDVRSSKTILTPALYPLPKGVNDFTFLPLVLYTLTSAAPAVFSDGATIITWPVFPPKLAVLAWIEPLYPLKGVMVLAVLPVPMTTVATPFLFLLAEICLVDLPRALPDASVRAYAEK